MITELIKTSPPCPPLHEMERGTKGVTETRLGGKKQLKEAINGKGKK